MKSLLLTLSLICSTQVLAIAIDEAGSSRPKPKKPSITIEAEVVSQRGLARDLRDLTEVAVNNENSVIVIGLDLDGDGVLNETRVHGDPHVDQKEGTRIRQVRKSSRAESEVLVSEMRDRGDCCHGLATGKRQHLSLDLTQTGAEGADGAIALSSIEERAENRRQAVEARYETFSLRVDNPSDEVQAMIRKGWDGTVKGGSKRSSDVVISVIDQRGRILDQVKLKIKGSGSVKTCGKNDNLCGKTDHL